MKRTLLLTFMFMCLGILTYAQGNENFTNYPETQNTYKNGTFLGMDGSTWSYSQCRGDSVIVAPSPTLGKGRNPTSKVVSGTIHNGCGTISFDYKQTFSTAVNLNLYINGTLVKNVTSTGQGTVVNSGQVTVNIPGDFTIMLKQADSTGSGQVTVDNIIWTAYTGAPLPEPTNYPTAFTATPAPFSINLAWVDATGAQLPGSYLILASEQNNIAAPVDGTPVANDPSLADGQGALNITQGVQHATFGNLPGNKQYFFKIFPYTNAGTLINYKTDGTPPAANATTPNSVIIDSIHFETYTFQDWIVKNVTGAQVWSIDSIHGISGSACAKMSGYSGAALVNEDWFITPAMNFNLYTDETLNFQSAKNYAGPGLECLISNDYDGVSNPSDFAWTTLTAVWSGGSWTWTPSGNVNVSGVNGTQVYIGFKYTSTSTEAATWELDDVVITGNLIIGMDENVKNGNGFSVLPNPASGQCKVVFGMDGTRQISLISMVGSTVRSYVTAQPTQVIDLTNLSSGIYFIKVTAESGKQYIQKLIVK